MTNEGEPRNNPIEDYLRIRDAVEAVARNVIDQCATEQAPIVLHEAHQITAHEAEVVNVGEDLSLEEAAELDPSAANQAQASLFGTAPSQIARNTMARKMRQELRRAKTPQERFSITQKYFGKRPN